MCGIVGWIDWKRDLNNQRDLLIQMNRSLTKRGPDEDGYWFSKNAALGHSRLVVIDSTGGKQPMSRFKGEYSYTLVYNGELYNTTELRNELLNRGYRFNGHSDTEVLLNSYLEWGPECVERLNGIFAFGIWDSKQRSLFLARDRLGVKPLFYALKDGYLLFASEIKALLSHPKIMPRIGIKGLSEILFMGPARTPGTGVFEEISELRAGHFLKYTNNGVNIQPYWKLPNKIHEDNFQTTVETIRDLFLDSVERQLVSDVPIGTLLSGGLDSSAITAVAANVLSKSNKTLDTFSVDYIDNNIYFRPNAFQPNEDAPWIEKVSTRFNTKHHSIKFDTPELVESLKTAMLARDLPGMADIDSSLYLFSKEIKKDITVGLSGECADEVFGGYPWFHREEPLLSNTFPWALRLENRLKVLSPELIHLLKPKDYINARYLEALDELPRPEKQAFSRTNQLDKEKIVFEKRVREISYLTLTRFMPTLLDRKDRMTMATGLEVRVPFCDHRLVEYVWNIPWKLKNYRDTEKGLLRYSLQGILPDEILWRRKSPYPKTHNPSYLQAVRLWLTEILRDNNSPLKSLINLDEVQWLINQSNEMPSGNPWFGQLMDTPQLFAYLIQLDLWLREYHVEIL